MKSVNDKAFGLMEFTHSWKKEDQLIVWGRTFTITIMANDLDEIGITSVQQDTYLAQKEAFAEKIDAHVADIVQFCRDNYTLSDVIVPEIISHLHPTCIVFQQDGTWGILMDSDYDPENGLALYFQNDVAKVGEQDSFL